MEEQNKCIDCRNHLEIDALKCKHCGSFQNWRRHIGIWGPVLSIFLGGSAVAALIGPTIQSALRPDYSFRISAISASWETVYVQVSNKGSKPIVLGQIAVYYPNDQTEWAKGSGILVVTNGGEVVEAASNRIIGLKWREGCGNCSPRPSYEMLYSVDKSDAHDDPLPTCGLAFTVFIEGEYSFHNIEFLYENSEGELNCNPEFWSFLVGHGELG